MLSQLLTATEQVTTACPSQVSQWILSLILLTATFPSLVVGDSTWENVLGKLIFGKPDYIAVFFFMQIVPV